VSSESKLKSPISRKWPVIVYFTGYPSYNGYPANWQMPFCQIHSQQQQFTYRKKQHTRRHCILSFLVSFL